MIQLIPECTDHNVHAVVRQHVERAAIGLNKYGVTTERTDLTRLQWLQHAQDEAMDLTVYLEKLKQEEKVSELAVANEREAIARFIESGADAKGVWGKNLAELIRAGRHLQK